jgi:hypothetical protein
LLIVHAWASLTFAALYFTGSIPNKINVRDRYGRMVELQPGQRVKDVEMVADEVANYQRLAAPNKNQSRGCSEPQQRQGYSPW